MSIPTFADGPCLKVPRNSTKVVLISIDPWADNLQASPHFRPFNYSVRKIEAGALSVEGMTRADVVVLDSFSKDADELLRLIEEHDPDILGMSTYVWSFPTFVELARRFKARKPGATVVMGGPCARPVMFELAPFVSYTKDIDVLVIGEGELAIEEIIATLPRTREALAKIPGIAVSTGTGWHKTPPREIIGLDCMPSPYQMDLVDCSHIGPVGSLATLETFRGCPLTCRFCQWGVFSSKDRVFSKDYLVRELLAIERSGATGVLIVDAAINLNFQAFHNLAEAEAEVGVLTKLDRFFAEIYPSVMKPLHLDFLERIRAESVGIGLQTYEEDTLKSMERVLKIEQFEKAVIDIAKVVTLPHIDIILGLPGDSPEAFLRTLERARQLPANIKVYPCLVLPDALLSRGLPEFNLEYDPYTLELKSCAGWTSDDLARVAGHLDDLVAQDDGSSGDGSGSWTIFGTNPNQKRRRDIKGDGFRERSGAFEPARL